MVSVLVNARYAQRPVTGVERVAREIVRNLTVEHRPVGGAWGRGARGHLAEQTVPILSPGMRNGILWSPANTGPVFHPHHVVTIHDVATIRHPEYFSARFRLVYQRLLRVLGRTAQVVVAPSRFTASELVQLGVAHPRKVRVIGNGIDGLTDDPELGPSENSVEQLPEEYLLTVGSLDPRKNLARLVDAYEAAWEVAPLPPLLVVGGGGKAFPRTSTASTSRVRYMGRVSDGTLSRLYAGARGVVNVSVYEGFGLTVTEAARFEVPLLLSDIPPHRELLSEDPTVIWTDPLDVRAITESLVRLTAAAPASHRVNGHTWADAGAAYSELLSSLAGVP